MNPISVVMATARGDYPMLGRPGVFLFEPTIRSLSTWPSDLIEELIIVDGVQEDCDQRIEQLRSLVDACGRPFEVRRLRPEAAMYPELHSICGARNTGLRAARAKYVLFMDDCAEIGAHAGDTAFHYLEQGLWPSFFYLFASGGAPRPAELAKDSRLVWLEKNRPPADGWAGEDLAVEWWTGFTAAPREQLLEVGGFDEAFDGDKSLEDVDLGRRMRQRFGARLVLDRRMIALEHDHDHYDPRSMTSRDEVERHADGSIGLKCNYALYRSSEIRRRWKAERRSPDEIRSMPEDVCREACPVRAKCIAENRYRGRFVVQGMSPYEKRMWERWVAANVTEGAL